MVGSANPEDTNSGPTVGTRPYMSPEAFEKVVTPKLDVYALGVILFELGTGLPPYSSKKKQDLVSAKLLNSTLSVIWLFRKATSST